MSDSSPQLPPGVSIVPGSGGGALGSLVERLDWSKTPVGPRDTWPRTLHGYVRMILELRAPAIIFWGPVQTQIYNDGYAQIMGPRHPRYLGERYADCWPDTYATIYPWMRAVLDRGDTVQVERTLIPLTRHGFEEDAYFSFTFTPLVDDDGKVAGILQLVTELTQEVLAERRAATLRAIATEGVAASLDANRDDVPFHSTHFAGDTTGARVPAAAIEAVLRDNRATRVDDALVLPIRRSALERPKGVVVLGISKRLRFDETYSRFLEAISREIAATLAAGEERAARGRADLERRNLSEYFAQTPIPLSVLEVRDGVGDFHFLLANEPLGRLVGRDVLGLSLKDALSPEDLASFLPFLEQVVSSSEDFVGREVPFRDRLLDIVLHPVREADGAVRRVMVFAQDVTDQAGARIRVERLAEELRAALATRDEFLSMASHELRTPITAMKLQSDVLRRRGGIPADLDPPVAKYLGQTAKGLQRLHRLVEDMLDISRIQGGRLELRLEPIDVVEVVEDAVGRVADQLAAAAMPLTVRAPSAAHVIADRGRLEQVLANVVSNAIRYAPGGELAIEIAVHADRIDVSVRDSGPGIAVGDQERIFGRFERLASSSASGGLGLGLFIARGMMEAQGGSLRVESALGRGSTFIVSLPRMPLADP